MSITIPIAKPCSIRDCGFDEYWLQDQIFTNPNCLGLGELEVITRERLQSSGGRLDLLLKDPEDDTMFEVEIMLGETDESHIIRTIEYWDNEKRKWPQRQHFAVLVAETITSRFFNVIQLFSHAIPIIAIQANILEIENQKILYFTKILDTYEEPEDSVSLTNEIHDEDFWKTKALWTIDIAKCLLETVVHVFGNCSLNFVKHYISLNVNGNNFLWLHKRGANKSLLSFRLNENLVEKAENLLDEKALSHVKKNQTIRLTVDKNMIEANSEMFKEIAKLIKQSWES